MSIYIYITNRTVEIKVERISQKGEQKPRKWKIGKKRKV